MDTPLKKIKECCLIEKIAKRFKTADKSVVVSIGDDAAVVRGPKGKYLLYTTDMLIESVHFKKNEARQEVGYKAMAVSVSDIAAMGGIPRYALVSVGLPKKNADKTGEELFRGLEKCAKKFGIAVIGGDTNRSDKLVIDVFMTGEVEEKKLVLRSGARPGDHIFVSGALGGSLKGKHLHFTPRMDASRFLVNNLHVSSMIDLSDGLAIDLNRIALASRVGAVILESKIPKSPGVSKIQSALYDGEDFELLFTLPRQEVLRLYHLTEAKKTDLKFYHIGRITDLFQGVRIVKPDARVLDLPCRGFRHF